MPWSPSILSRSRRVSTRPRRPGIPSARGVPSAAAPEGWLRAYAQALRRAWVVLEPLWTRSADALDREVERVSVAVARGAGAELIAQSFPYCEVAGDELLLPSHSDADGRVRAGSVLRLHPLLAPVTASGWTDDYEDVCLALRYSVPNVWRVFDGDHPPPASLAALVGSQRAKLLRGSSGRPPPGSWPSCCMGVRASPPTI